MLHAVITSVPPTGLSLEDLKRDQELGLKYEEEEQQRKADEKRERDYMKTLDLRWTAAISSVARFIVSEMTPRLTKMIEVKMIMRLIIIQ
jgi:hypothetical protein